MGSVIKFDQTSDSLCKEAMQNHKFIVDDLMKDYKDAKTVPDKIEILKAINSAYNTSINAAQVTVNAIKVSIEARESQVKYSGLLND